MIIKGKSDSGFEFEIEQDKFNNMELMDAIADSENDPMAVSKVVSLIFGDDKKALYDHVRLEDGRVPMEAVSEELENIFNKLGDKEKK